MNPTTFTRGSDEHKKLEAAATMLTVFNDKGNSYYVRDVYFDYGQNWIWTTIIAENENGFCQSWQAVSPREWAQIVMADTTVELCDVVNKILEDE